VTNRKDTATQVDAEMLAADSTSATDARKAMLQSAHNFSFVRQVITLHVI